MVLMKKKYTIKQAEKRIAKIEELKKDVVENLKQLKCYKT